MPEYEIHDNETGLKLAVSGDTDPTQDDAHELIQNEFNDIRTNLFQLPDGKFFLDVGPLKKNREVYDDATQFLQASDKATAVADAGPVGEWGKNFDAAKSEFYKTNKFSSVASEIMKNHPPGTLYIMAHGSPSDKNLGTEWGHKFTLNNIASVLGKDSSAVSNIVNTACYGGSCEPKDYESAFPSARTISHVNTNSPNTIQIRGARQGVDFSGEKISWQKDPELGWITDHQFPKPKTDKEIDAMWLRPAPPTVSPKMR